MFSQDGKRLVFAAILGFAAMILLPTVGFADLVVMSSTTPGYKPGDTYSEDTIFTVPSGKYIKLKLSSKGSTHKLRGPFSGHWNGASVGSAPTCLLGSSCSHISNGSSRGEAPGVTRGAKKD